MRAPFVDSERVCSAAHLAMQLRKQGYITQLRNAKPKECNKACGRTCLEKLQHTYILVTGSLDSAVTVSLQRYSDCQPPMELMCPPPDRAPSYNALAGRFLCAGGSRLFWLQLV